MAMPYTVIFKEKKIMNTVKNYYKVIFDSSFVENTDCMPRNPIKVNLGDEEALKIVKQYLSAFWENCYRNPSGTIKHPYLVPGGGYEDIWDWDTYFMACAVPDHGLQYAKGSIMNLIDGMLMTTGRPAKKVSPGGFSDLSSHPYPLQAQFTYIVASRMNDFSWVEPIWDRLERMIEWFDKEALTKDGYYVWTHSWGNGIDNNPAVYGRPAMSSAGVDLASWHYREFKAMEKISRKLNKGSEANYREKAEKLKLFIQKNYWDEVDRFFYNVDCNTDRSEITLQYTNWAVHLKFKSWASLFPLWAKTATQQQAKYMVDRIMSEDEYLSCCGIRSHSANDPVYNNVPMGNPSNWQGPVWGLSTFLTAYSLSKYGYKKEALEVANRLIKTYAADITQNQCIHEYYHGDTGQPLIRPEFISWNILALKVVDDIKADIDSTTLDLLDD